MEYNGHIPVYDGDEHFKDNDMPINKLVSDFWRWCCSDLMNNTMRGALAEFIVASALDIDTSNPRVDWEAYDLLYKDKIRIEVKCSAYLQSWHKEGDPLSNIVFSIAPALEFNSETNSFVGESERHSDYYVFCVFKHKVRSTADVTKLEQWDFFILPTAILNERCRQQKTITLNSLNSLKPYCCDYNKLKETMDKLIPLPQTNAG